jgi:lycopene cyclase domain-containing protein
MKQLYLLILVCSIVVPFAFSFHPKLKFHHQFKAALLSILLIACPFILWDIYFTKLLVWGFNTDYLLGIFVYNLPLEEVLFFICIPFCCLFTHHALKVIRREKKNLLYASIISILVGVVFLLIGLTNAEKIYSLWTFASAGISLILLGIIKPVYLSDFMISYLVLLLPFFIVNGILTGTGPDSAVVWYNNSENLGIRVLTIPVEDFFYGMNLILWNVVLFEMFSKKFNRARKA